MIHVVVLATASALLVWSGLHHLRDTGRLQALLISHRLLAYPVIRVISRTLGPGLLLLGLAGCTVATLASWTPSQVVRLVEIAVAAVYGALAVYSFLQLRRTPDVPCGCFGDSQFSGAAVPARAIVLASLVAGSAAFPLPQSGLAGFLALAACGPLAVLLAGSRSPRTAAVAVAR